MPIFEFDCPKCAISWEEIVPMSKKAPKTCKCPECGKRRLRVWSSPFVQFKGADWESNSHRTDRFRKEGFDQDSTNEFLKESIKSSKKRMSEGGQHYKQMVTTEEGLEQMGYKRTRVSDKQSLEKSKIANNIVKHVKTELDKNKE